jgi:hypothetical protein
MQRLGVPTNAVDCLFSTLQNATHQVRTAYGDLDYTYGGTDWDIPMHGIGQGNGAGPRYMGSGQYSYSQHALIPRTRLPIHLSILEPSNKVCWILLRL